ncbi:MAG TPA: hypothetical protein VMY42_25470 [Thermoguttaceae bacterium]|nr:hypothetical protein [Thermoguttaceae bacterium]
MTHVEQAVFTSARTDRSAGYQVVSQSPGVCEADVRELAVWGPSHDSLLESGPEAVSLNFHPLPSGAYCVSRTTPAGFEYSSRGGHRIYTQCLVVPPEVLARFANNPFALSRAALAGGTLRTFDPVPEKLEPLLLPGKAAPVDQNLLTRLANNPGAKHLVALLDAALASGCLAVAGRPTAGELIAGLFSCLPVECRTEFSFSTGLKFSSRRPFRIVAMSDDRAEQRWVAHHGNVTVMELSDREPAEATPVDGWARLIGRVLASGRTSFLATQLSRPRPHLGCEDLPALALQLFEELDDSPLRSDHESLGRHACEGEANRTEDLQRAHAAHRRFEKSSQTVAAKPEATAPSKTLRPASSEVLQRLQSLDDAVYEAVSGQAAALEKLEALWSELSADIDEELLAEARQEYLRYALSIWEGCTDAAGLRNPTCAIQVLDVLHILFDTR